MTLNGITVLGHEVTTPTTAYLTLQAASIEQALSAISPTMTFLDGAGAVAFTLFGFDKVSSVELVPDNNGIQGVYKLNLALNTNAEAAIASLGAENTLLRAQVQALSDRNEFMEDVIAEMAMQVYA